MPIIAVYSYRRGVGKSTCIANIAALLTHKGQRVGVISPHLLTLGQLVEDCGFDPLESGAIAPFPVPLDESPGQLFWRTTPLNTQAEVQELAHDLAVFQGELALDYTFIELVEPLQAQLLCHLALCDVVLLMLSLDQADVQHTATIADIAQQLGVTTTLMLMSQIPPSLDSKSLQQQLQAICPASLVSILPWAAEVTLGADELFYLAHPTHPLTQSFQDIATQIQWVTSGILSSNPPA